MLDKLVETIETLKRRIKDHGHQIEAYESRTRVALIDPLLCALEWNVANPEVVEIEPRTKEGWADYALLGSNGKPVMFVEAKSLSENISRHVDQAVKYAIGENLNRSPKIQLCAVTNGKEWQVYDVMQQDCIWEASVDATNSVKTAFQFLSLWRNSLGDGSFEKAGEPLLASPSYSVDDPPVHLVSEPPSAYEPEQPRIASRPPSSPAPGWVSLMDDFPTKGAPSPIAIRLPDGQEMPGKNWRSIIIETAVWLHRSGRLTTANCTIQADVVRSKGGSPSRNLMSLDGMHPKGQRFKSPVKLPNTSIIIEGNFSARDLVRQTRYMLQHFSVDPATVHLKFSE